MTEEQYHLQRSIAEKILAEEEEEYRLFLDIPDGPPTSQCLPSEKLGQVSKGQIKWSVKELHHLHMCSYCKMRNERVNLRLV